ncbi:BTAD domain-containing putative transcriptional regulator [Actinoplanes sp. ATCC 53533]|uniref:BTAD domain-containing putative transcriptional regulator n=1 Tax=Actinoplanes sp. ATCC 53533 TaxID=1288362 RepID=UPI00351424D7
MLIQGHDALSADRPAVAGQRLDVALSLWRGRPLEAVPPRGVRPRERGPSRSGAAGRARGQGRRAPAP